MTKNKPSVKTDVIDRLWPGEGMRGLRRLAMQRTEITEAIDSYCRLIHAGTTPKFSSHFSVAKAAVEAAYEGGERHRDNIHRGSTFKDRHGDIDRDRIDSVYGEGTYDGEDEGPAGFASNY